MFCYKTIIVSYNIFFFHLGMLEFQLFGFPLVSDQKSNVNYLLRFQPNDL